MDLLKKYRPNDYEFIAVLQAALMEPERTFLLCKARNLNDANDATANAQSKGATPEEKKQKVLAKTPVYLRERVEDERPLPCIEIADFIPQQQTTADSQAEETEEQDKKQEKLTAVLQCARRAGGRWKWETERDPADAARDFCGALGYDGTTLGPRSLEERQIQRTRGRGRRRRGRRA
jgi:hypothetical protein